MNRAEVLQQTIKDLYGVQIDNVEGILKTGGLAGLRKALDAAGVESAEKQLQRKAEGDAPSAEAETTPPSEAGVAELMKAVIDGMAGLEKSFGEYKAMMEAQNAKQVETDNEVKATKAAQTNALAGFETRLKAAEERLNTQPRSAVGNAESAAIGDKLKENLPARVIEYDPAYPGMKVPLGSVDSGAKR